MSVEEEIERLYLQTRADIKKYKSIERWLDEAIIPNHTCTVLVFYRGSFCNACSAYLDKWNQLRSEIKAAGGMGLAITSQPKDKVKKQMVSRGITMPLIADTRNRLAERYDIPILKAYQSSFLSLQSFFRSVIGSSSSVFPESDFKQGMVQPAVLILDRTGKELFSWRSRAPMASLNAETMADPTYLIRLSLGGILPQKDRRLPKDFDEMMKNPEAKEIFRKHLEQLYCAEMLLFLEEVDEINARCKAVAERFILDSAPNEVNISSDVRAEYSSSTSTVFSNAYAEIKQSAFLEYAKFIVIYNAALPAPAS